MIGRAISILSARNRSVPFRDLLLDTLMRSSLVEVHYILIQNALELLLLQDEQMIEAFLSDAPHIAFADGISSWGMIRRFQHLDAARFRHTSKARPEFAVVIPDQILWCLPIRSRLSQRYSRPKNRSAIGSHPRG